MRLLLGVVKRLSCDVKQNIKSKIKVIIRSCQIYVWRFTAMHVGLFYECVLHNQQFKSMLLELTLGSGMVLLQEHFFKVHRSHLQSRIIVLPIIPHHPFISPSLFISSLHSSSLLAQPSLIFLPFLCPSIHLPATPPSNHFSWVGLIKGDLTECADHRNINQSLSNTVSPPLTPPKLLPTCTAPQRLIVFII